MAYDPNANAKLKNITSLAQYAANKFNSLSGNSGGVAGALDTVPATVDGGLWYELDNGSPVIKFYYDGNAHCLYPTIPASPQLALSQSSITVNVHPVPTGSDSASGTVDVSYLGSGSISLDYETGNLYSVSYNASTKKITVTTSCTDSESVSKSFNVTVSLSAAQGYTSASTTLAVTLTCGGGVEMVD